MQRVIRLLHKPTNQWYWVEVKLSWNVKYYSFDDGQTWHKSKIAAFEQAAKSNSLQPCQRN